MKISGRKYFSGLCFALVSVPLFIFGLSGCDIIGLGPAVDTLAPIVKITSPEINAVVRSTFVIEGTCEDDTNVKDIQIAALRNTDSPEGYTGLGYAVLKDDKKNWSAAFEYDESSGKYKCNGIVLDDLKDGTYIITVIAHDESGRESPEVSCSFDVDNTAPVFLVSNPSAIEGMTANDYGRSVKITGTIADGHSIEYMKIRAYDDAGEIPLAKSEFRDFDKANTSVVLANYSAATQEKFNEKRPEEKLLQKNYMSLLRFTGDVLTDEEYKSVMKEGRTVRISVELKDKAGNVSRTAYLPTGMKALAVGLCGLPVEVGLDASDYMNMLTGNYKSDMVSADGQEIIRDAMRKNGGSAEYGTYNYMSYDNGTDHKHLVMNINPNNSPKYHVSGCGLEEEVWNKVGNGNTFSINVKSGRDSALLDPGKLSIKIYKAKGNGCEPDTESPALLVFDSETNSECFMNESKVSAFTLSPVQDKTYNLRLPSTYNFPAGGKYIIVVYGEDDNGNEIIASNDSWYGFEIMSNGKAPWIECDEANAYRKVSLMRNPSSQDSRLNLSVHDSEALIKDSGVDDAVTYTVMYYAGHYESVNAALQSGQYPTEVSGKIKASDLVDGTDSTVYTFSIPISGCPDSEPNYTVVVKAKPFNGTASPENDSFYLVYGDNAAPSLAVTNLELKDGADRKINKDSPSYFTKDDNGTTTHNYKLEGTVSDVGGSRVSKIRVKYVRSGENENAVLYEDVTPVPKVTDQAAWNFSIKVEEGLSQKIIIETEDEVGNKSAPFVYDGIVMDFEPPSVRVVKVNDAEKNALDPYYTSKPVISIKASDKVAAPDIKVVGYRNGVQIGDEPAVWGMIGLDEVSEDADGKSKLRKFTPKYDGEWKFVISATDEAGLTSAQVEIKTVLDTKEPSFDINALKVEEQPLSDDSWFRNNSLRISGKVSDQKKDGSSSDLKAVYYKVLESGTVPESIKENCAGSVGLSESESEFKINVTDLLPTAASSGTNVVYLQAEDNAGNLSEKVPVYLKVDLTMPSLESKYYSYDDSSFYAANGIIRTNGKNNLILYGNVDDINETLGAAQSGIKTVVFKNAGTDENLGAEVTYSSSRIDGEESIDPSSFNETDKTAVRSYRAVISKEKLASGSVKAVVEDVAGNQAQHVVFSFVVDNEPPEISLKSPLTKLTEENGSPASDSTGVAKVNGAVRISGSASDSSLDSVKISYSLDPSGTFTDFGTFTGPDAYNWTSEPFVMSSISDGTVTMLGTSYTPSMDTVSPENVYIKITATDTAANSSEKIYKYTVDPESDRPVITFNNMSLRTKEGEDMSDTVPVWLKSNTIYGNVSDDDGVQSFMYKKNPSDEWIPVELSNGSWTIDVNSEGDNRIYFYVKDIEGTEFISRLSADDSKQYSSPKLKANIELERTSILNIKVDTKNPEADTVRFMTSSDGVHWSAESDKFSTGNFGGTKYRYLKLLVDARDSNGISDVSVKFDGEDQVYSFTNVSGDTYESETIDLHGKNKTDPYTAILTVTDNAESRTEKSVRFNVDNLPPAITINVPDIVKAAVNIYGSIEEAECEAYFAVTDKLSSAPSDALLSDDSYAAGKWLQIDGVTHSFNIGFDGNTGGNASGTHTELMKWYISKLGLASAESIADGSYTDYTDLRLYVRAVDKCGNQNVESIPVSIDPQGDKPSVSISQPHVSAGTIPTLGGSIMITGTASDTLGSVIGVKHVALMLDVTGDGKWGYDDIAKINSVNSEYPGLYKFVRYAKGSDGKYAFTDDNVTVPSGLSSYEEYALKTELKNGTAWELRINEKQEFNPLNAEEAKREYTAWVFAVDGDLNSSIIDIEKGSTMMSNVTFKIDSDVPQIKNLKLVKFDDSSVVQSYERNMAVKGKWYYEADVYDDTGISEIKVDDKIVLSLDEPSSAVTLDYVTVTPLPSSFTEGNGYHVKIAVGTEEPDEVLTDNHTLFCKEIKDGTANTNSDDIQLRIDNKAPKILKHDEEGFKITEYGHTVATRVVNKNGFYTFGSKAREDAVKKGLVTTNQTGISYVAFYITRDVGDGTDDGTALSPVLSRIYDPMIPNGESDSWKAGYKTNLKSDRGLYWFTLKASSASTGKVVNFSSLSPNVHVGGLVKISGVIYTIESITADSITIKGDSVSVSVKKDQEISFAMANVVDNTIQEGDGTSKDTASGYWNPPAYDDGDLMVESLVKQGTTWTWEANINTKNIGDGNAVLHYVVFDEAGNYAVDSVEIYIGNNLPRIAGMTFATKNDRSTADYDSDEIYSGYSDFYAGGKDGRNNVTKAVFPSDSTDDAPVPIATVKNKMRIQPEIVGGNGKLYYTASLAKRNAGNTGWSDPYVSLEKAALKSGGMQISGSTDDISVQADVEFSVSDMISKRFDDGGNQKLRLLISDSTPGEVMEAEVSVILNLALKDSNPPVIKIRPFYWNGSSENSLFGESLKNGHIELPSDLPSIFESSGTGLFDRQPKVSGKIKVEGIAQDDAQLEEIKLDVFGTPKTLGTYDGGWKITEKLTDDGKLPESGYAFKIEPASYDDLLRAGIIESLPENKAGNERVKEFSQEYGHLVKWTAYIDTQKALSTIAGIDKEIKAYAEDCGTPNASGSGYENPNESKNSSESGISSRTQSGSIDGNGAHTDYYAVDVVPYITDITTALKAKLKSSIKAAYSRTALGHYIARDGENIAISGFNLGTSENKPKYGSYTLDVDGNGTVILPASKIASSGKIELTLGGIKTLNNLNDNNAKGSYGAEITEESPYAEKNKYAYNRQPNRTSNNLLTDDVVIDVWQFDSDAALPMSGELREPSMKINPVTGTVGVAFVSGPAHVSMAGTVDGTAYSYAEWQRNYATYSNISFAYDDLGHAHSTATGLDTNPNDHHAGRFSYFYDNWYTGDSLNTQTGNYDGKNAIRLDSIAVPYIEAILSDEPTYSQYLKYGHAFAQAPYYRVLSNDTLITSEDGALTETRFYSPSLATTVHGTKASVYLAYFDSVQKQIRFRFNSEVASDKKTSKDDFIDEKGYKQGKTGDLDASGSMYYEPNSQNFSLIAGVDTQEGEIQFVEPYTDETTGTVLKTDADGNLVPMKDADGNILYRMSDYRQANLKADGTVEDAKDKGYTIAEFTMDDTILNSLHEDLRSRFTVGQKYKWIQNDKYKWIIQDDCLIYYTTENNSAKGYITMVPSTTYMGHDKSVKVKNNQLRKLDPAEQYIVYEKVGLADSSIDEGNKNNQVGTVIDGCKYKFYQQPNYFWPYSDGKEFTSETVDGIPIVTPQYVYKKYDTGYTGYKYVAIDAKSGSDAAHDTVVAVWYDGTHCRYAYNDNPTSRKDNGSAGGWKGNKVIFSEGGEHCAVKIDPNGGVHIAAYVDGGLRYAYLSSPDADYNEETDSVLVDSFTITGERITLDVGKDAAGNVIPYISYFNGTARLPCVARLVVPENVAVDYRVQGTGTIDGEDIFTGNWEISLVPSSMNLTTNYNDKMNIGLWKQDGVIVSGNDSRFTVTGGESGKTSSDNSSGTVNGNIYGNGTANPIIGYAVESNSGTNLETAQLK
ncbi:MAG: hypothetical protein II114_00190 [Treponema sp.]|nr:hypothetical protein [Treponema sp.]